MIDKPTRPKVIYGKTDNAIGYETQEGWPVNSQGQQTEEQPDPLIYGYQKGGMVMTPGNIFRRRLALMQRAQGYQRGGRVEDPMGDRGWAGRPTDTGGLPPGLQGTLPPGLASRDTLPPGLANWENRGQQPDQTNTNASTGFQLRQQPVWSSDPATNPMGSGTPQAGGGITYPAPGGAPSPYQLNPQPYSPPPYRIQGFARGGKIAPLNPANKGKFTASAKGAGKSVQGFASEVLNAPKGQYSATQRKRANFARNASKWNK